MPFQRAVDRCIIVRSRKAVVRGHMNINPARDTAGHEALEHSLILAGGLAVVGHFFCDAEVHAEAWADMLDAQRTPARSTIARKPP